MIDSHFDFSMTTATERNKVVQLIRYVCNQVASTCVNVMNMQAPAFRAGLSATPAAGSISFDNLGANTFPSAAMSKVSAAAIVGVTIADHPAFRASMGTKGTFALYLRSKCTKLFATLLAVKHLSGDKSRVSTFGRAVTNLCVLWMKLFAAHLAGCYKLIFLAPFFMALRSAKVIHLRLSYLVAWFGKGLSTVVAPEIYRVSLALIGASATTQKHLLVVGLELSPALGANLEHR